MKSVIVIAIAALVSTALYAVDWESMGREGMNGCPFGSVGQAEVGRSAQAESAVVAKILKDKRQAAGNRTARGGAVRAIVCKSSEMDDLARTLGYLSEGIKSGCVILDEVPPGLKLLITMRDMRRGFVAIGQLDCAGPLAPGVLVCCLTHGLRDEPMRWSIHYADRNGNRSESAGGVPVWSCPQDVGAVPAGESREGIAFVDNRSLSVVSCLSWNGEGSDLLVELHTIGVGGGGATFRLPDSVMKLPIYETPITQWPNAVIQVDLQLMQNDTVR